MEEKPTAIRNAAKAIIYQDGKVLLNRCSGRKGPYYALPGGGQNQYETMEEAVVRECLEETGYRVTPLRLAGICEEISTDAAFREKHPDYAHKIYHIFLCHTDGSAPAPPLEEDSNQRGTEWVDLQKIEGLPLFPEAIRRHMKDMVAGEHPLYLR